MTLDRATSGPRLLAVRSVAGPDAGWSLQLEPGSHWLGRVGGGVSIADPAVEAHHALLDVVDGRHLAVLQTAGRTPLRVDGVPALGWTEVREGSTIEVGATRLEIGLGEPAASTMAWVFAPLDASAAEHVRFARDVALAAGTAQHRASRRPSRDAVDLGVAFIDVAIDLRDGDARPVALADLDHPAQAVVERRGRVAMPLWVTLTPDAPIAIVAQDPEPVADSLVAQLTDEGRAQVIVAAPDEAGALAGSGRPMLVLTPAGLDPPPWCRAVLDVGATWRGTWCADIHDRPGEVVRLHVRGLARWPRSGVRPRGPASADAGRTLVAQQVAGPAPEFGRGVVGIPQAARRQ